MDKENVIYVHIHNGMLFSLNKEIFPAICDIDISLEDIMLSKIKQTYKEVYCMYHL